MISFFYFQLSDVSLEDASDGQVQQFDASAEFAEHLAKNALRFAFADGVVTNVCPDASESNWTVNIKRAVLATLQNSMEHMDSDIRIREVNHKGLNYISLTLLLNYTVITLILNVLSISEHSQWRV